MPRRCGKSPSTTPIPPRRRTLPPGRPGWDAIDGSDTWSNKEWVVLNPTALLIQR